MTTIFPAIDLLNKKVVRLTEGVYGSEKIYSENPLSIAQNFEKAGFEYLHIVDLDGAKSGQNPNFKIVQEICSKTNLKIQIGGGIRDLEIAQKYFNCGVSRIIIGSAAIKNPELLPQLLKQFGTEKIVLGLDVRANRLNPPCQGDLTENNKWGNTTEFKFIPYKAELKNFAREMRKNPTPSEKEMWEILKSKMFLDLKFTRQKPLLGFIADFYCAKHKLVIEVDGSIHEGQKKYDFVRDKALMDYGITVLRFSDKEVLNSADKVKNKILKFLKSPLTRGFRGLNYEIFISGWTENSGINAESFLKNTNAINILMTDIAKDGKLTGPNINMYKYFTQEFPNKNFIASGGVSNLSDIKELQAINMSEIIVGKAIYEGKIELQELLKIKKT